MTVFYLVRRFVHWIIIRIIKIFELFTNSLPVPGLRENRKYEKSSFFCQWYSPICVFLPYLVVMLYAV